MSLVQPAVTVLNDDLRGADPRWLGTIRFGLTLNAMITLLAGGGYALLWYSSMIGWYSDLIYALVAYSAIHLITQREPTQEAGGAARVLLRLIALVAIAGVAMTDAAISMQRLELHTVGLYLSLASVPYAFLFWQHLAGLARRRDRNVASHAMLVAVLSAMFYLCYQLYLCYTWLALLPQSAIDVHHHFWNLHGSEMSKEVNDKLAYWWIVTMIGAVLWSLLAMLQLVTYLRVFHCVKSSHREALGLSSRSEP